MSTDQNSRHSWRQRLALTLALGALLSAVGTSAVDGAAGAAGAGSPRPLGVQVIRVTTHAFDWGDAGIGAAAGIGISMLAVGAGLLLSSTRHDTTSTRRPTLKEQP